MSTEAPRHAGGPLLYPFAAGPAHGTVTPVAPGVHWLRMPLPFRLDHINLWLLEDGDGWTIIDTGLATGPAREVWAAVLAGPMRGRPVRRLLVTHFHPDHFGLAAWLMERCGCELWMAAAEHAIAVVVLADDAGSHAARQAFFRRHGLDRERLELTDTWRGSYRDGVPEVPSQFVALRDQQVLRIGDHDWRVITATGHSPDHVTLHCQALGLLISGDQILPQITPHIGVWHTAPEADPVRGYLHSLARFEDLPPATLVLPAHGLPFTGLAPRLEAVAAHHARRLEIVANACTAPSTATGVLDVLFRRRLDVHQIVFALGETIAHLNYLCADGALARSSDAAGVQRYTRT